MVLLPATAAWAQWRNPGLAEVVAGDTTPDGTPIGGVYVNDSAIALDKLALAQRLEEQKDWSKSAEVYQEITDRYRDRVVPSPVQDDPNVLGQYTSVLSRVNDRLSRWPEEGLAVYRGLYELPARKLLESAGPDNLGPLHEAFTRYFVTSSGLAAGRALISDYFERGEFAAAEWIGRQLLSHPGLGDQRALVLFQIGLAAHLSGDEKSAADSLDELKSRYPASTATVGGSSVILADELARQCVRPVSTVTAAGDDDSWPMPGGDPSRGRISTSTVRPGALLYSVRISQRSWRAVTDPTQLSTVEEMDKTLHAEGAMLGVMPVADHGQMFFQNNSRIIGVNIDDGTPLPGWLATYPNHDGQYWVANAVSLSVWHQYSLTLTDDAVLGVVNLPDPLIGGDGRQARLVCLDRATGKERWSVSAADLPDNNLKQLVMSGSPLVVGGNVYLAARGGKGNGYEDSYVLCLDLATGAYRWSCYLASAPATGTQMMNPNNFFTTSLADGAVHLSYASGRIFVCTNLGAVAALDAYDGNVAWLSIYRDADDSEGPPYLPMRGWAMAGDQIQPPNSTPAWATNAPIVRDGRVFVLPSDGKYLLVYDAGTGHVLKKLLKEQCCTTVSDEDPERPITLLGVIDDSQGQELILVGTTSRIFALNWRQYDSDHPGNAVEWASMPEPKDTIRGRAFVTADSVYIPTALALYRLELRNGEIAETYPADSTWPDEEGPGNVLICGNKIIVAGDARVNVYTDLTLARQRLDAQVAAAPDDPEVRLRYAEVMFLANRPELAIEKLDEARHLLAKGHSAGDDAARKRAFSDAMTFAVRQKPDLAAALFDRAAALATSPADRASLLMARAGLARFGARPDYGEAIQLYQQVLADAALRRAPVPDVKLTRQPPTEITDQTNQAGDAAAAAIAQIVRDEGPSVYQPIERAAGEKLARARAVGDAAQLLEIAEEFPNSDAAAAAAQAAADEFEAKGDYAQAARVLREIYFQDGQVDPAVLMQGLARNYLRMPGRIGAARACLIAAQQPNPDAKLIKPLSLPDGRLLPAATLHAAMDQIDKIIAGNRPIDRNLPDLGLPSRAAELAFHAEHHAWPKPLVEQTQVIQNVDKLLIPSPDCSRGDRIVTWTSGAGLSIFAPGQISPIGTNADLSSPPLGVAWTGGGGGLLVWSASNVAMVDGADFHTRWNLNFASLPELTILASAEPQGNFSGNMAIQPLDQRLRRQLLRQRLMLMPRNGGIFVPQLSGLVYTPGLVADDEQGNPSSASAAENIDSLLPVGDLAVVTTTAGRVAAINLDDGSVRWQTRAVGHAIDRLVATSDFTVFKLTDQNVAQLVLLDTDSGRMLARKVFNSEPSVNIVNFALGEDGTLAYTESDRLVIHELFQSAGDRTLARPITGPAQEDPMIFQNMGKPNQLIIADGQVLALCEGGDSVRGYDDQTGRLRDGPMRLSTGDHNDDEIELGLSEGYLYAYGPRSVAAYNIENPQAHWGPEEIKTTDADPVLLMGSDYLILLEPPPSDGAASSVWLLSAFSRTRYPDGESGKKAYESTLDDPSGIVACQAVSGGVCYLAGDRTVHMLLGNRNP